MPRLHGVTREDWRARSRRLHPAWVGISRSVRPRPFTGQRTVTRTYIDHFIEAHRSDIRGRAVEIRERDYTKRFDENLTSVDVLDIDPSLPEVTIVADLTDMPNVPSDSFDVAIITATLQYVFDVQGAIKELHRILAPGGTLLLTVPAAERLRMTDGFEADWWRFTSRSLRKLLSPFQTVEVETFGNSLAAIAVYRNIPATRLGKRLWVKDPRVPVVVAARAVKEGIKRLDR